MKACTVCKKEKSLEEFSWKNKSKGVKARECKECHRKLRRAYYLNNTEKEKARTSIVKVKYKEWFKGLKLTLRCSKCSEDSIACLDFHHLDPNGKDFNVSYAVGRGIGKTKVLEEISKCIVLCANCHRKLHAVLQGQGATSSLPS